MVDKLEQMVAKHDAEIAAVNQRLSGIESAVNDIKNFIQSNSKPNISAISLMVTIAVLAFAPIVYGIQMQQADIMRHENILIERAEWMGMANNELMHHKKDIEKLESLVWAHQKDGHPHD